MVAARGRLTRSVKGLRRAASITADRISRRMGTVMVSPCDNKNAFMHGNVWESVEDCYKDDYCGAPTDARLGL
jgi:hypothetical protein